MHSRKPTNTHRNERRDHFDVLMLSHLANIRITNDEEQNTMAYNDIFVHYPPILIDIYLYL